MRFYAGWGNWGKLLAVFIVAASTIGIIAPVSAADMASTSRAISSSRANLAAAPANEEDVDRDPLEGINRVVFGFNRIVDKVILKPITQVYRAVMPEKGRELVTNALTNIYTPVTFANSVLQGDVQNSFASMWRFIINSTVGIGGLFDVASEAGLKMRPTDFGQTLAIYGAGSGPYVVLPIIGPSNTRDSVGRLADAFMTPFNYMGWETSAVLWSVTAIDKRSNNTKLLDDVYSSSLDPYATFRSGYIQKRDSDIRRAKEQRRKDIDALCTNHPTN